MSKKKLQIDQVTNELEGASLYFHQPARPAPSAPQESVATPDMPPPPPSMPAALHDEGNYDTVSKHDYKQASMNASTQASIEATKQNDLVETIRKTVKPVGKEISFVRLTPQEKHEISSIVFTFNQLYRGEGRKTSENEINRIAINSLIVDYQQNGEQSILARVLAALNA